MTTRPPTRRTVLTHAVALGGGLALAGCAENPDDEGPDSAAGSDIPMVENPPNAVYVPTHMESMEMLEATSAGDYTVTPMVSYQHAFWLVDGTTTERVDPETSGGVHLMALVWDDETGTILPIDPGASIRLERDGEQVGSPRSPWTMLSQGMGFHLGDNVPLEEDGEYIAEFQIPSLSAALTGSLEGRFTEGAMVSFSFTYDEAFRERVVEGVEYHDEAIWGQQGANEPMHGHGDMGPTLSLPPVESLPGTELGTPQRDDAVLAATLVDGGSRFGEGPHVLLSARTPYNDYPLPHMGLELVHERDGDVLGETELVPTVDGEVGFHYGAELADIESGDDLQVAIHAPPQVARHAGYETAFLEMDDVTYTVP